MWVIYFALFLQLFFIVERVLHVIACVFFSQKSVSDARKLSERNVVSALFTQVVVVCAVPVQIAAILIDLIVSRLWSFFVVILVVSVLAISAHSSQQFMAFFLNVYNSGVGIILNLLFVQSVQLVQLFFQYLIPLYNAMIHGYFRIVRLLLTQVISVNVSLLPSMAENVSLLFASLGLSVGTFLQHSVECIFWNNDKIGTSSNATLVIFTEPNLHCIANDNYVLVDLMTPSIYCRAFAENFNEFIDAACSSALLPINAALYFLQDYNFYLFIHSIFNALIIHPIFALPIKTVHRCNYGLTSVAFTQVDRAVMCMPDFTVWIRLLETSMRALGKLFDNWLNVILLLVESTLGIGSVGTTCANPDTVAVAWRDASHVLGSDLQQQNVGLTPSLYAITNGVSTVYHSLTQRGNVQVAIGNWPVQIEPRYGIAAIKYNEVFDSDENGVDSTGMLGCRCSDSDTGIKIQCFAVPYLSHLQSDDAEYSEATSIKINFSPADANKFMTCSRTRIKISPLRFSRKRYSVGSATGTDANFIDMFETLRGGERAVESFSADAAIYVQPMCSLRSTDPACIAVSSSCFPFCLGLHISGSSSTQITLFNAQNWESFINLMQLDCVAFIGALPEACTSRPSAYSGQYDFNTEDMCAIPEACKADDYVTTSLPVNSLSLEDPLMRRKINLQPTIRLSAQPFVIAGDILLFEGRNDESEIVIVKRLYDNNRADFTLQNEMLTLVTANPIKLTRECVPADGQCHAKAALNGEIVLPPADRLDPMVSTPTAVSEWGVHWAVNPDNSVLADYLAACRGEIKFAVGLEDAYGPARVWTLKATRAHLYDVDASTERMVSYMQIPDWLQPSSAASCDQEVNLKVVDLEFINDENILVTVLRAAPKDYDWYSGSVCADCEVKYARYFIHPNVHECLLESDSDLAAFTCWQSDKSGLFSAETISAAAVSARLGTLCPAVRRMPELGSFGAELGVAGLEILKIGLDAIFVVPAVLFNGPFADLFHVRVDHVTFHTALDSNGGSIFSVEVLLRSVDRATFYAANTIAKVGNLFARLNGYEDVKPVVIGTTKVLQHMNDAVMLSGPLLSQLKSIRNIPSLQSMSGVGSVATGGSMAPNVVRRMRGIIVGMASSLKFNTRLFRRFVLLFLRMARAAEAANTINVFVTVLHDSHADFERSMLDNIRVQCDGLGNIFYTDNPWARTVRNACLILPDTLQAVMNALLIFVLEYPIMSCACKLGVGSNVQEHVHTKCMGTALPAKYQVVLKSIRDDESFNSGRRQTCFAVMDVANFRLETVFDKVFSRLSLLATASAESLNHLIAIFGIFSEDCQDFQGSPYAMSIVPDPVDYFIGCGRTFDCRTRCQQTFLDFESVLDLALHAGDPPHFHYTAALQVRSRFFDDAQIEAGEHMAPFDIHAVIELPTDSCSMVCGKMKARDRCVFIVGRTGLMLLSSYYCVPADFMTSVFRFQPVSDETYSSNSTLPAQSIVSMHVGTLFQVRRKTTEAVIVCVKNDATAVYTILFFTPNGVSFTLLEATPSSIARPVASSLRKMAAISDVRVIPAAEQGEQIHVYVKGVRNSFVGQTQLACTRFRISSFFDDSADFINNMLVDDCMDAMAVVFPDGFIPICRDKKCSRMLRLPLVSEQKAQLSAYNLDAMSESEISDVAIERAAKGITDILALDPSDALYQTATGTAVLNRRHLASNVLQQPTPNVLDIFVVGGVNTALSWLHVVRIEGLDSGLITRVSEAEDIELPQDVDLDIDCSPDNCIGCQTSPPQARFAEVQSRCFAAAECALSNCIGTPVNLRQPLCNLGNLAARSLEFYRIALQTGWIALARSIIIVVELSESRRRHYELDWMDESLMAFTCDAKDGVVEFVATFSSIVGASDILAQNSIEAHSLPGQIDPHGHAQRVMTSAAVTRMLSSIALFPMYTQMAVHKVVRCAINDTVIRIQNVLTSGENVPVRIEIGSRTVAEAESSVVGICLSVTTDAHMRQLGSAEAEAYLEAEVNNVLGQISALSTQTYFGMLLHPQHAFWTYLMGVVRGVMDVAQTSDYLHCRPPVAVVSSVGKCVCGDRPARIPRVQSTATDSSQLWCTGPLLLVDAQGDEQLIWNPFTFNQLNSVDYTSYLQCISESNECSPPFSQADSILQAQGSSALQVMSRCRANYQNKRWDPGAIVFGLLDYEDWVKFQLSGPALADTLGTLRRQLPVLAFYMHDFVLSRATWSCLHTAAQYVMFDHNCAREALREIGYESIDHAFPYEDVQITGTPDACQLFSGPALSAYSSGSQAARSLIGWSPSSENTQSVGQLHQVGGSSRDVRLQRAVEKIDEFHKTYIEPELQRLSDYAASAEIKTRVWSGEGDELHQIVDCVMMGPFAAADMHVSLKTSDGQLMDVPQYHRGDPTSRNLPSGLDTGGSFTRKRLIGELQDYAHSLVSPFLQSEINDRISRLRVYFNAPQNLLCVCPDLSRSIDCCSADWKSVDEINFGTKNVLDQIWDVSDVLTGEILNNTLQNDVLRNDLWTSINFTSRDAARITLTDAQRFELHHAHIFDTSQPVREYSLNEVPDDFELSRTLWDHCTSLLSGAFFTLPLREGTSEVDANLLFDPTTDSFDGFTHALEAIVERILTRAREDTPVFWTHVHRYVPSDSVWCENEKLRPAPPAEDVFETKSFYELLIEDDTVLGVHSNDVTYPTTMHCLCNWTSNDASMPCATHFPGGGCWSLTGILSVEEPALATAWDELCTRGQYGTKADFFLMLRVLEGGADESWMEYCHLVNPAVSWGLMDSDQYEAWYNGGEAGSVSLHEIATRGPGGARIGMLGRPGQPESLLRMSRKGKLLRRSAPGANFALNHTIGQPICEGNLENSLPHNLSMHVRDMLFPMAHTIHEAPASAHCSTWVIEYGILHAMQIANASNDALQKQMERTAKWKLRCQVHLEQLGICLLRDVFSVVPYGRSQDASSFGCEWRLDPEHGCDVPLYITDQCMVVCSGELYDPCRCNEPDVTTCDKVSFRRLTCTAGLILDVRNFADDEQTMTRSLHWPHTISEAEGGGPVMTEALNTAKSTPYDIAKEYNKIMEDVNRRFAMWTNGILEEAQPPHDMCDDLLDYWPSDAQHPVGYHPTCACAKADTNIRGFESWMSVPVNEDGLFEDDHTAWAIDPIRLRNMTQYSSELGSAHLVCDALAYGLAGVSLNPFYLETAWDATFQTDPAMPLHNVPRTSAAGMHARGLHPTQDPFETGLVDEGDYMKHSAGLVRAWFRDVQRQVSMDAAWPHWDETRWQFKDDADVYGSRSEDACDESRLFLCQTDADCASSGAVPLTCLHNSALAPDHGGICAVRGTCFQHSHCDKGFACSGEGVCVQPRIFVHSDAEEDTVMTVYGQNHTCSEHTYGVSQYQDVPDFAQAHGVCNMRAWEQYVRITQNVNAENRIRRVADADYVSTRDLETHTVRGDGILEMRAHPCDRSFEHVDGFARCTNHNARTGYADSSPSAEPQFGTQTWFPDGSTAFCDLDERDATASGFLHPYKHITPNGNVEDTLANTPTEITRCRLLTACPDMLFMVDGVELTLERQVADAVLGTGTNPVITLQSVYRAYTHTDAQTCGAVGHLVKTSETILSVRCIVDRLAVPLLTALFGVRAEKLPVMNPNAELPANHPLSVASRTERFTEVQRHCVNAFGGDLAAYLEASEILSAPYDPADKETVESRVNNLWSSIFGNRGFLNIEDYLQHSRCAQYILQHLNDYTNADSMQEPYAREPESVRPGASLYLFHKAASAALPFRWLWQCVIIARSGEGGAPNDWTSRLMRSQSLDCANYELVLGGSISLRQHLQTSSDIFDISTPGEPAPQALFDALQQTIQFVLDDLRFPSAPNVWCLGVNQIPDLRESVQLVTPRVDSDQSWARLGRDPGLVLDAEARQTSVMETVLQVIFGNDLIDVDIRIQSLEYLIGKGVIAMQVDLDSIISSDARLIPSIVFPLLENKLRAFISHATGAFRVDISGNDLVMGDGNTVYARRDQCISAEFLTGTPPQNVRYRLENAEFLMLGEDSKLPSGLVAYLQSEDLEFLIEQRTFSRDEIVFLVLHRVKTELFNTQAFLVGSLHSVRQLQENTWDIAAQLRHAHDFATEMSERTTPCGDTTWHPTRETNPHHRRLRECVQSLASPFGWTLKSGKMVQVEVPFSVLHSGFFPAITPLPRQKFLEELFTAGMAGRASAAHQICFVTNEKVQTINPFWATRFDIETGCDIDSIGPADNGAWAIDAVCAASGDVTCLERSRAFASALPSQCADGVLIQRLNTGSLPHGETLLCEKSLTPMETCDGPVAVLHGVQGVRVQSLTENTNPAKTDFASLWQKDNTIVRVPETTLGSTDLALLRVASTDIAGHSLGFRFSNNRLELECVNLASTTSSRCTRDASDWMRNIEQYWAWYDSAVPKSSVASSTAWHCPFTWWARYSNSTAPHAARTPNAARNRIRFAHITTPYTSVHPAVSSLLRLPSLRPARFMSDIQACTDRSTTACRGRRHLLQALAWVRSSDYIVTKLVGDEKRCDEILDWPHTPFRLHDTPTTIDRPQQSSCSVIHRLPSFAVIQQQREDLLRTGNGGLGAGGACKMGRLRRIPVFQHRSVLQHCRAEENGLRCLVSNNDGTQLHENIKFAPQAPPVPVRRRRRPCSLCDDHRAGSFVRKDQTAQKLQDTAPSQLSVGRPVQLHPARALAARLRRLACRADDKNCTVLDAVFNSSDWDRDKFLQAFLQKAAEAPDSTDSGNHDEVLWNRPWAYCRPGSNGTKCAGTVPKDVWLNAATRPQACIDTIMSSRPHETEPLQFCKIDATTAKLCQSIANWNAEVLRILCQALDLPECPTTAFFYTPTTYSLADREFVADTVHKFYNSTSPCACPDACSGEDQSVQVSQILHKCASRALEPILTVLEFARAFVIQLTYIQYYFVMTISKLLELIIAAVSASQWLVDQAFLGMKLYWQLFILSIKTIMQEIEYALYMLIFEQPGIGQTIVNIVRELCRLYNQLIDFTFVVGCPLAEVYQAFILGESNGAFGMDEAGSSTFDFFQNALTGRFLTAGKPPWVALSGKIGDQIWQDHVNAVHAYSESCTNIRTTSSKYGYNALLNLHDMKRAREQVKKESKGSKICLLATNEECLRFYRKCELPYLDNLPQEPKPLFSATRCWSTYNTFFGDDRPLSCSAQDTCSDPYLSNVLGQAERFEFCANEGETCTCYGRVRFGSDGSGLSGWSRPTQATSSIRCSRENFDAEFVKDGPGLSCQCRQSMAFCHQCPEPPAGRAQYGCDPYIKQCACSVPQYDTSRCVQNSECAASTDASCRFLDSGVQLSSGAVPCATCRGITSCFSEPGAGSGVCTCALPDTPLGTCPASEHSQSIWPPYDKLCLYQTSEEAARSVRYEAAFRAVTTARCMDLDTSSAYCFRVTMGDGSLQHLVTAFDFVHGRRLLGVSPDVHGQQCSSMDPTCVDAAASPHTMAQTHFACRTAADASAITVLQIQNLTPAFANLSLCTFATARDLVIETTVRPKAIAAAFLHPGSIYLVLTRHTAIAAVLAEMNLQLRKMEYMRADEQSHFVPAYANYTSLTRVQPRRTLLNINDWLAAIDSRVRETVKLHQSFATQVGSAFRLDYVPISDKQAAVWLENWPPRATSADQLQCTLLFKIVQEVDWSVQNATQYYAALDAGTLPGPDTRALRNSWPKLRDSSHVTEFASQPIPNSNFLSNAILWLFRAVIGWFGRDERVLYDAVYTMIAELKDSFKCDIESVQMCSKWRVTFVNGVIVILLLAALAWLVLSVFGLGPLMVAALPLIPLAHLALCYDYKWTCLPLIPTCIVRDYIDTVSVLLPAQISPIPEALLKPSCTRLFRRSLFISPSCLQSCADPPHAFTTWMAPLAWVVAEFGMSDFLRAEILPAVPILDTAPFALEMEKMAVALRDDNNVVLHRVCAVLTAYRLVPIAILALLLVLAVAAVSRGVLTFVHTLAALLGALCVNAFT